MNKERLQAERLVYKVFDELDPSGQNTDFWKKEFSKMSDAQFKKYISNPFPFYYQIKVFEEPSMERITKALEVLNVPLLEPLYLPYKFTNKDGKPIRTKQCLVFYLPIKRMKQLLTKKNGMSLGTDVRDMKSGLLTGVDKNGKESDREFESLALSGLYDTMKELSRSRADSMNDKSVLNNTIRTLGQAYLKELPEEKADSLSKNQLSAYFIGAQLYTNMINDEYLLPYTIRNRQLKLSRED